MLLRAPLRPLALAALAAVAGAAELVITADNACAVIAIDGVAVPLGPRAADWTRVDRYRVEGSIGHLAVRAENFEPGENWGGLRAVVHEDDGTLRLSGAGWRCWTGSDPAPDAAGRAWTDPAYDDAGWPLVDVVPGGGPWGDQPDFAELGRSRWIWAGPAERAVSPVWFRAAFAVDDRLALTADARWDRLYVDGASRAPGPNARDPLRADDFTLAATTRCIAVRAHRRGNHGGGLRALLRRPFGDPVATDGGWRAFAGGEPPPDAAGRAWSDPDYDDSSWPAAAIVAGGAPQGDLAGSAWIWAPDAHGSPACFRRVLDRLPAGPGLRGEYYANKYLQGPAAFVRVDPGIDIDWGDGSPGGLPKPFSVRWSGTLTVPESGRWTFAALADDGVAISIDGRLVASDWFDHAPRECSGEIDLAAGAHAFEALYYDAGGGAVARVSWSGPGAAGVIPASAFADDDRPARKAVIPDRSRTSPLALEGLHDPNGGVDVTRDGEPLASVDIAADRFIADVELDPAAAVEVGVATAAGGAVSAVTWTPTRLGESVLVRVGDALLIAAERDGELAVYASSGISDLRETRAGELVPVRFTRADWFTVEQRDADGVPVGHVAVTAVGVDLSAPLACQVGFARQYRAGAAPDPGLVAFGASDPWAGWAGAPSSEPGGALVGVLPRTREPVALVARLGDERGPVIAAKPVESFEFTNLGRFHVYWYDTLADGTRLARSRLYLEPWVRGLDIRLEAFVPGFVFGNGQPRLTVRSDAFLPDGGGARYDVEMAAAPGAHFCHTTAVYQGEFPVSR